MKLVLSIVAGLLFSSAVMAQEIEKGPLATETQTIVCDYPTYLRYKLPGHVYEYPAPTEGWPCKTASPEPVPTPEPEPEPTPTPTPGSPTADDPADLGWYIAPVMKEPSGADNSVTACPVGCDHPTPRAAGGWVEARIKGGNPGPWTVEIYGGDDPNRPIAYGGFYAGSPNISFVGYGAVQPEIITNKEAVRRKALGIDIDPTKFLDIDSEGATHFFQKSGGLVIRDISFWGQTGGGGASGLIRLTTKGGSATFNRIRMRGGKSGLYGGAGSDVDIIVLNSLFYENGSDDLNHDIYAGGTTTVIVDGVEQRVGTGSLTIKNSVFRRNTNDGNHIHSRSRKNLIQDSDFGEDDGSDETSASALFEGTVEEVIMTGNTLRNGRGHEAILRWGNRPKPMKVMEITGNTFINVRSVWGAAIRGPNLLDKLAPVRKIENNILINRSGSNLTPNVAYLWIEKVGTENVQHRDPLEGLMLQAQ